MLGRQQPRFPTSIVLLLLTVSGAHSAEPTTLHLSREPAAIVLDGTGATARHAFAVELDPAREPADLVVQFTPEPNQTVSPSRIRILANGQLVCLLRIDPKETATARIPRLFLKPGANELVLEKETDGKITFRPLVFPNHKVVIGPAPAGKAVLPGLEVWGEPVYRFDKGEVVLWVAVQGAAKEFLRDARVEVEVAGRKQAMMVSASREGSALAQAAKVRYEAAWPLAQLAAGPNPARVTVQAEGYRQTEMFFPLRKPFAEDAPGTVDWLPAKDQGLRAHAVAVEYQLLPGAAALPFRFRVLLPEKVKLEDVAPGPGPHDYDRLMAWTAAVHGRGGVVFLDRAGKALRERFDDYVYLVDADGFVVLDEHGWDPAVEPGGEWDRLLHQRQRVAILGMSGRSRLRTPGPGHAGLLEGARRGAVAVADGPIELDISLDDASGGGLASLPFETKAEIKVSASFPGKRIVRLVLVSDLNGVVGQEVASWSPKAEAAAETFRFEARSPCCFRALAWGEDGSRAVTAPIFLDVRPAVRDQVVMKVGRCRLFTPPKDAAAVERLAVTPENQAGLLPLTLGTAGCRKLVIPFTPAETGYHVLELGLDPGARFAGGDEKVDVSLDGKLLGTYRADHTIHGAGIRHVVPFRVSLGKLSGGKPCTLEVASPAPEDGIGLAYAHVLRTGLAALALVDLHSHSKIEQDFSNGLHRTMGFNLIATAHGPFASDGDRVRALARAKELCDNQLTIQIGGEKNDRFGAVHISMGFLKPPLEDYHRRDQKYAALIPVALDWGGVAVLNHPYQDNRLSWVEQGDRTWGTADPYYHGFAGWSHHGKHLGAGDHFWRLLTHVEYLNGYSAPGVAAGRLETNPAPRCRWHEELGRFVRGERRAPLFGVGNTDTKTFQQDVERTRIGSMYSGTMVHAASLAPAAIEAAYLAGNSTLACHADTRLLVSVTDAAGNVYHPGNHVRGPGPYTVHVEAWAPRDLALVRVVGPRGTIVEKALQGFHVKEDLKLEGLGPWDWFLVELRGHEPRTAALSNAFLR